MAVTGMKALYKGIGDCFDKKLIAAQVVAGDMSKKALRQFQQHQFSAKHEPRKKAKTDSSAMKAKAREFAAANQGGTPVTTIRGPWTNRTFRAARTVIADYGKDDEAIYFNLYHTMSYGVYLELAKNRKYAVLEPIIRGLAPEFLQKVKEIYAG